MKKKEYDTPKLRLERFRAVIEQSELSQNKFAPEVGLTPTGLSDILNERVRAGVTDSVLRRTAKRFRYREEWLMEGILPDRSVVSDETIYQEGLHEHKNTIVDLIKSKVMDSLSDLNEDEIEKLGEYLDFFEISSNR